MHRVHWLHLGMAVPTVPLRGGNQPLLQAVSEAAVSRCPGHGSHWMVR